MNSLAPRYKLHIVTTKSVDSQAFEVRHTRFALPANMVVFFHPDDADAAERISAQLDADTLNLTGLIPSPPAGTLEIHLADG